MLPLSAAFWQTLDQGLVQALLTDFAHAFVGASFWRQGMLWGADSEFNWETEL